MANHVEIKAAEILSALRDAGEFPLHPNWRRDHVLVAAVRLLARRGLVASRRGRLVLYKRDGASAFPHSGDPEPSS